MTTANTKIAALEKTAAKYNASHPHATVNVVVRAS